MRGKHWLAYLVASAAFLSAASTAWHAAKLAPFTVYSDGDPKAAKLFVAELEQLRFSLGELLGIKELTIRPGLEVFLMRGAPASAMVTTRTGIPALVLPPGPLSPESRRLIVTLLLDQNTGRMPPKLERGLAAFLSTTETKGAHVIWGAPPPLADRDLDWALVDWLVTTPDTYGKFRVLLANLENGVDPDVAYRNSIGKTPAQTADQVKAFLNAGRFPTIDGPSRPLNPDRDVLLKPRDAADMALPLADLLDRDSGQRYRDLLNGANHKTEAEEGLALLAVRGGETQKAQEYCGAALRDGSKNAYALLQCAHLETDPAKIKQLAERALTADANSAEAHFLIGKQADDPAQRIEQWRAATKLAPRQETYWVALAQTLQDEKHWIDAANAWRSAEQAAETPEQREKDLKARLALETLRLDEQEKQKREAVAAEQREEDRLKKESWDRIHAAEAKASEPDAKDVEANAVPWEDIHPAPKHLEGKLARVDCVGGKLRFLQVRGADGKLIKLTLDPAMGSAAGIACGATAGQTVAIDYEPVPDRRTGVAGETTAVQLR
jgi:hypothetical protein